MAGKFVVTKGKSGQYHFNLKAGNGEIIATSEAYKSKAAALAPTEVVTGSPPPYPGPFESWLASHRNGTGRGSATSPGSAAVSANRAIRSSRSPLSCALTVSLVAGRRPLWRCSS